MLMATILFVLPPCAFADTPDSASVDSAKTVTISLLTCAPGSEIYELEGHSGLRIQTPQNDFVVNWGLFDFDSPGFVYRFVRGETDYMVGTSSTEQFLAYYRHFGRKVTQQTLNLDSVQALKVYEEVEKALSGPRTYRYKYVSDNCAIRPLRLLEAAISPDTLHLGVPGIPAYATKSFRRAMTHFHTNYPWYQFGINLALGTGIDTTLIGDEMAFAPVALQDMIASATIQTSDGAIPAVKSTTTLVEGKPGGVVLAPTPWFLTPMAVAIAVLIVASFFTWADMVRRISTRWIDSVLFGIFGVLGCVMAFLVFVSVHEATSPNYLLLWLNPFCLIVPAAIWTNAGRRILPIYHTLNLIALIALVVMMAIMNQMPDWAFIPLVAADAMRSISYIYVSRCERKKKKRRNRYQIRYSGYSYSH